MNLKRAFVVVAVLILTTSACEQANDYSDSSYDFADDVGKNLRRAGVHTLQVDSFPTVDSMEQPDTLYPGPDSTALFRVTDLLAKVDGGVYVSNSGYSQVLAVNSDGSLEWRFGREGDGPGEFKGLGRLQALSGDTIVAMDEARNRASFVSPDGELVRTSGAPEVPGPTGTSEYLLVRPGALRGVLSDGRMFLHGPSVAERMGTPGLRRMKTAITLVGEDGSRAHPFSLPGPWLYELREPQRLPAVLAPMSVGASVTVSDFNLSSEFVWARPDTFQIVAIDASGRIEKVLSISRPRARVTSRMRDEYLQDWSPWVSVEEDVPFPPRVPTFDRVFVTRSGDVWTRRFDWREDGEEWIRWDGESAALDRFHFPPRVRVMDANSRFVYGVGRNEVDVEYVLRFRLPS